MYSSSFRLLVSVAACVLRLGAGGRSVLANPNPTLVRGGLHRRLLARPRRCCRSGRRSHGRLGGDAHLGDVCDGHLLERHQSLHEGALWLAREAMVNRESRTEGLEWIACELGQLFGRCEAGRAGHGRARGVTRATEARDDEDGRGRWIALSSSVRVSARGRRAREVINTRTAH